MVLTPRAPTSTASGKPEPTLLCLPLLLSLLQLASPVGVLTHSVPELLCPRPFLITLEASLGLFLAFHAQVSPHSPLIGKVI